MIFNFILVYFRELKLSTDSSLLSEFTLLTLTLTLRHDLYIQGRRYIYIIILQCIEKDTNIFYGRNTSFVTQFGVYLRLTLNLQHDLDL